MPSSPGHSVADGLLLPGTRRMSCMGASTLCAVPVTSRSKAARPAPAHAADRWRSTRQGKAAVGRGGRPLDPEHARDLERIFKTDAVIGFAKLIESDVDAFELDLTGVLAEDYAELYAAGGAAARAQLRVRGVFNLRSPFILDALEERANM